MRLAAVVCVVLGAALIVAGLYFVWVELVLEEATGFNYFIPAGVLLALGIAAIILARSLARRGGTTQ